MLLVNSNNNLIYIFFKLEDGKCAAKNGRK